MQIPGPWGPAVLDSLVLEPKSLHFYQLSLVTLVHRNLEDLRLTGFFLHVGWVIPPT